MGAEASFGLTCVPRLGLGWTRVAQQVAQVLDPASIDRIWLFTPVRRDDREWGTAVISSRAGSERRRIFTATYLLITRGRDKGHGRVTVDEVGESPPAVVHEVIAGVQERADECDPPVEIAPARWFGDDGDEPSSQS